jgi:hypothetical protein
MDSNLAEKISKETADRLWFVARGSVLKGPYSTDQLREKVTKKEISFMDFCWRQGFNEWRPIGSLDDFDRRHRLKSLPRYPNVEVPASMTGGIYLQDTSPPEEEKPVDHRGNPKKSILKSNYVPALNSIPGPRARFEVSFAKQRRHSISIYEWGLAAILGVLMAYFSAQFAMNEVSRSVSQHLSLLVAGVNQRVGERSKNENSKPVHPEMWMPLYSAPSFMETLPFPHEERLALASPVSMDVELLGHVKSQKNGWLLKGYAVEMNGDPDFWSAQDSGLDPVYLRPVQVFGKLSPQDGMKLQVHLKGEPILLSPTSSQPMP